MLLCIEYDILFVDTVDTKIKAHNALNAMFVETVDTRFIRNSKCMSTWSRSCLSNSTALIPVEYEIYEIPQSGMDSKLHVDTVEMCVFNSTASIPVLQIHY